MKDRPGGHGVFPMEVDSFGQKGAKDKGSQGGDGKQRSAKESMAERYNCGRKGHCSRDCWHPRQGGKDNRKGKGGKARKARTTSETKAAKVKAETKGKETTRRTHMLSRILGSLARPVVRLE